MAAAFFMPRSSLAAASAAGETCLSGCAAGACPAGAAPCLGACAMAEPLNSASVAARPAADKIPEKPFIPILLDFGVTAAQQHEFLLRPPGSPCWQGRRTNRFPPRPGSHSADQPD